MCSVVQTILLYYVFTVGGIAVAESNDDVRILIGSCEIVACAHAQYKIVQKQPRMTGAASGGLKLQCIAIATLSSCRMNKKFRERGQNSASVIVFRLMLCTRLASPIAVCIAIRGRYTQLA